ncbi:MAG: pyridoxamine 5'-phosphate oxidase [Burkholderiaceae bacterium]|nr:pyridoxamine 5'-phosphate oxidase [Burkholderiaceae bacterium]
MNPPSTPLSAHLTDLRKSYERAELNEAASHADPMQQFSQWLSEAISAQLPEPNAMTLATVGSDLRPSTRIVLIKGCDERGLVWFTNYESRKGRELAHNPNATLLFPWAELGRQVIVEGAVARAKRAESEAYFATRERNSQLSAWASQQSRPVHDRATLDARFDEVAAEWEGREVECPPFWGGFHLRPSALEFWQQRPSRRHDRFRYIRAAGAWEITRLQP